MGKINFEEYRQPWETGPHWELKREFMEKYQNDFPEDRLLCLAQAYSNIELLNCSYPDPVMVQIHELSKSLNGCKRFREAKNNYANDEPELQARSGKRSASEDLKKPFKFIKFYSVGNQLSEADGSTKGECFSAGTPESNSSAKDVNQHKISSAATPSNSQSTFKLSNSSTENKDFILSLAKSPDFDLMKQFASPREKISSKDCVEVIERTVDLLGFRGLVRYTFEKQADRKSVIYLCRFYIKDTLICIGRCATERGSIANAAFYAVELFTNFSNLPLYELSDLNSDTHMETLLFLHNFLQEATKPNRAKLSSLDKITNINASLKSPFEVSYFFKENFQSPLRKRFFYVDLVINKVLICTTGHTRKKKAKLAATDQIIPLLEKFFKEHPKDNDFKSLDPSLASLETPALSQTAPDAKMEVSSVKEKKVNEKSVKGSKSDEQISINTNSNVLPKPKEENLTKPNPSGGSYPCIKPDNFKINYVLMNNSMKKQFAILDMTEITPTNQIHTPRKTLTDSAQFCKKPLLFDVSDNHSVPSDPCYRCDIGFDGKNVAVGTGPTKNEAKINASVAALKCLEKQVYTIKVKTELDESFIVKREQMMSANVASDALSDNNLGCKMLKMMGWTGGGIGKTGGITEPIMASEHRFNQGLGFAENNQDEKKFRRNIEALLKEFSQTETTSDLIFSTDFTKDERKIIHSVAVKFGLNSTSRGKNESRRLFVKHKISVLELLQYLTKVGGWTQKYELVDRSTTEK